MKKIILSLTFFTLFACGESIDDVAEKGCSLVVYYQYYLEDPENQQAVEFSQEDLKKAMENGGFTLDQVKEAMNDCEADPNLLKEAYELSFEENVINVPEIEIEEEEEEEHIANASLTIKGLSETTQSYEFIVSPISEKSSVIHEEFTVLTLMDSRNWSMAISFEGNQKGEFKLTDIGGEVNLVTVNVGQEEYMSSLRNGVLSITDFTEDGWVSGNFHGLTGINKDIEVSGNFKIQAKRYKP